MRAEDTKATTAPSAIAGEIDRNFRRLKSSSQAFAIGTDRGGKITVFRQASRVVRIDLFTGLSNADRVDSFYYLKGKLIFIRKKEIRYPYSETRGFDFEKPQVVSMAEYYVYGGNLMPVKTSNRLDVTVAHKLIQDGNYLIDTTESGRRIEVRRLWN